MKKRTLATAAAAAMALSLTAGPAFAAPAGGDGACVAAGVQNLKGVIGVVASDTDAGTIAAVILAHTKGDGSGSGVTCS